MFLCTKKDSKIVKKWLSFGYFAPERLGDSIDNRMGLKGILGCSFVPKDPKLVKKWLSYGYFPFERLRDFIENYM